MYLSELCIYQNSVNPIMKALKLISSLLVMSLFSYTWVDVSGDAHCGDHGTITSGGCCSCNQDYAGSNNSTILCANNVVVLRKGGRCDTYCQWERVDGTFCGAPGSEDQCEDCLYVG